MTIIYVKYALAVFMGYLAFTTDLLTIVLVAMALLFLGQISAVLDYLLHRQLEAIGYFALFTIANIILWTGVIYG